MDIVNPPVVIRNPPVKVELALDVFKIEPPVMVSPAVDSNPPPATEIPELVNVEVAVPWMMSEEVAISPWTVVVPAMRAPP